MPPGVHRLILGYPALPLQSPCGLPAVWWQPGAMASELERRWGSRTEGELDGRDAGVRGDATTRHAPARGAGGHPRTAQLLARGQASGALRGASRRRGRPRRHRHRRMTAGHRRAHLQPSSERSPRQGSIAARPSGEPEHTAVERGRGNVNVVPPRSAPRSCLLPRPALRPTAWAHLSVAGGAGGALLTREPA